MNCFITVWNRWSWLEPLCEDFTKAGLNVILIDNKSDYPPCLDWLNKCPYEVIRMNHNSGAWGFFTTGLYQQYKDRYFMISDSDQSITGIPSDWVQKLFVGLNETSDRVWKSGLSQEIEDLPDNPYANEIKNYEKAFWSNQNADGYYKVYMDLGIAIYDRERRGENPIKEDGWYCAVRSPRPYVSRHLDWWLTPETTRVEDVYYLKNMEEKYRGWAYNWILKYGYKI